MLVTIAYYSLYDRSARWLLLVKLQFRIGMITCYYGYFGFYSVGWLLLVMLMPICWKPSLPKVGGGPPTM